MSVTPRCFFCRKDFITELVRLVLLLVARRDWNDILAAAARYSDVTSYV